MKRADGTSRGPTALDLVEEATHLLRRAPVQAWAAYYAGGLPFMLGFLWFWMDMARNPFASRHLAESALGIAALFFWMKLWQAIFAAQLRNLVTGASSAGLGFRQYAKVLALQTILQPVGFIALPLSLLCVLPFPWVYAFFQNLTVFGDSETGKLSQLASRARKQAGLWPTQNLLLLLILGAFGFFVFLNCITVCMALPGLLRTLVGTQSVFTRSPFAMLNTTFFAAMLGLAFLIMDPLVKATYVLRCFYGESRKSGEDLKAQLRRFSAAAGVACLVFLAAAQSSGAERQPPPAESSTAESGTPGNPQPTLNVPAPELDRTIQEVIRQNKYAWRTPRETTAKESDQGVIGRFLTRASRMIRHWIKIAFDWLEELLRRWFKNRPKSGPEGSGYGWIMAAQLLLYLLVAGVVIVLCWLLYRAFFRAQKPPITHAQHIAPALDLSDENVSAAQLPEEGWINLARELLGRGEWRLAMRAFFLGSLVHLASRNLITLAKFKSNRDYERELRRRGHSFSELNQLFEENVSVFEGIWYGMHQSDAALVSQFADKVDRIRAGRQAGEAAPSQIVPPLGTA